MRVGLHVVGNNVECSRETEKKQPVLWMIWENNVTPCGPFYTQCSFPLIERIQGKHLGKTQMFKFVTSLLLLCLLPPVPITYSQAILTGLVVELKAGGR